MTYFGSETTQKANIRPPSVSLRLHTAPGPPPGVPSAWDMPRRRRAIGGGGTTAAAARIV
jgi:hypothetical protein